MEDVLNNRKQVILPVLPLKNLVALPKSIIPVVVGREFSIKAVEKAMKGNKHIFVVAQKAVDVENPNPSDLFYFGTRGVIVQLAKMPNGSLKILVEGVSRSKVVEYRTTNHFMDAVLEDIATMPIKDSSRQAALWRNVLDLFKEYIALSERLSGDILGLFRGPEDLDYLTDVIAVHMTLDFIERQHILEMLDLEARAMRVCILLKKEIEILRTEKKIKKRVQTQVEKHQKDYYLTEQMRAIQKELGREDYQVEINELRKKAKKLQLSKEAMEKVEAELKRLDSMQQTSPEASVSRNYVEWILSVPWYKASKDTVSLDQAEKMLNSSHSGMKKPKERVIEFLAARKYAGEQLKRSPIICLAGPPGVGKTSLAQAIADSLGRPMVRISLGGLRDEAEIRGHRRTYIGAMPGKIIQAMKRVGVVNPVVVLDEIDKMSVDFRGDPASALLEVLDPEQNKAFVDHFLEVEYDLSKVMFIATANVVDSVPYPLLDRLEVIYMNGYTLDEKLAITKDFLLPKLLKEHALKANIVQLSDEILKSTIDEYTKEAGVRQLERTIAKILRKSIQELLRDKSIKTLKIDDACVEKWLGAPIFRRDDRKLEETVGMATGLAWTEVGGDVLEVEVAIMKGKGGLTLTGQLGEVMQESAQAAMSYIRSRGKDFGLKDNFYSEQDIHVHVPEGAIPKDGPSAGITLCTAITSALTKISVRKDTAMTGEVTLRGRVLAVGGLKEKILAASRMGFTNIIVPYQNQKDIKEFESELDKSLKLVYVKDMDEVLSNALTRSPFLVKIPVINKKKPALNTKKH
ncbi:MAG: Lon protease [candidate division TM6 bacterium GW2011_GWF2_37_49]|nr:MAG: Lon protease [candidate division TM6 bacterium GW2011_GWF2_37_49]